jgi:hypothetical protein
MVLSEKKILTDNKDRRMLESTPKKSQSESDCGQREFVEKYLVLTFILYFM